MAAGGGGVHGSHTQRHGRPNLSTPTEVTKHITDVIVPSYGREIRPPWLIPEYFTGPLKETISQVYMVASNEHSVYSETWLSLYRRPGVTRMSYITSPHGNSRQNIC